MDSSQIENIAFVSDWVKCNLLRKLWQHSDTDEITSFNNEASDACFDAIINS